MMGGDELASLYASFGFKVDTASVKAAESTVSQMQSRLDALSKGGLLKFGNDGRLRGSDGRFFAGIKSAAGAGGGAAGAGGIGDTSFWGRVKASVMDVAGAIRGTGKEAEGASASIGGMWQAAAMAAAAIGIEKASHLLIGFNQEVQDSKISLSAMISGMTGADWNKAVGQADSLYNEFQRFSTVTPVTTQQILDFGKGIAAATFAAGGGVEELKNLTEQGVIAAKVLAGDRGAGYAELEITELLSGVVNKRMILARQLLSMGHISEEAFKALDGKGRIAALQKIFNSDAMNNARDAFGGSFSGVTSTLWDNLQITFGQVGKPLFNSIIAKVRELNKWMQANKATIEEYAKVIGAKLVAGLDIAVAGFQFVTDHATFFEGVLIGLGSFITAFAVGAAIDWAIAFWPITLAVGAIALLHAGIKWLEGDADDTTDAFGRMIPNLEKIKEEMNGIRNGAPMGPVADRHGGKQGEGDSLHGWDGEPINDAWMAERASLPAPTRDMSSMPAAQPAVTVRPQVSVQVTGNMPEGWIDTKIDSAIQDHHETTMINAANALQADDEVGGD